MKSIGSIIILMAAFLALPLSGVAQQQGSIAGQVQDTLGGVIVGATVTITSEDGRERTTTSNQRGEFTVSGLAAGRYKVTVFAPNFALYDNEEVDVTAGRPTELTVFLTVEVVEEVVEVAPEQEVSTDPGGNLSATVLKGADIDALPDDPDELEAALQALAGPAAGPGGGQIYIDGFTGGRLPPREAIREIRINQNPFSAEYDRLGFGRIEILTRPGFDRFRGSAFTNFNDSRFNSRNPFAPNRAPGQTRFFGGNISGPIQQGRSSFFFDINNRDIDSNRIINAIVLDQDLNAIPFQQDVKVPTKRFSMSPRFDYQINTNNTLQFRYNFSRFSSLNQGVGDLTLPSRAFETSQTGHEFRITETMIINARTINETRFQYDFNDREQSGDNSVPTINVGSAFVGGGSQVGRSFNRSHGWELQNYTTTSLGKASEHSIKFGVRIRGSNITDRSESNFGGSFSFINLDAYRETILGNAFPTSFTVTTGNPEQKVSQTDIGLFITDDWRVNQGLTLSFGLRYENQTNVNDSLNFAPRLSFAWAPGAGGARAPKTVLRGGFGIFYDRFSENLTLQARRFDGTGQLSLLVNSFDPDPVRRAAAINLLQQAVFSVDGVTNVPTAQQILAVLPQSNTLRTISPDLQSPYMMQGALGVERQLPRRTSVSVFYITSRTLHVLRARNINAPICPEQIDCLDAPRPMPDAGDLYQYESSGILNQNRIFTNIRSQLTNDITIWGNYSLGFTKGDSDGAFSFPAYSYDLSGEYGRASSDVRHNFVIGGSFNLPYGFTLNPFINANSGSPFNIVRGIDTNGDGLLTERPTFGELAARCSQLGLNNPFCDIGSNDPNQVIPRNYADGPKFFNVNLRVGKNFGFGSAAPSAADTAGPGAGRGPGGGGFPGMGRGGRGGGGRGGFGGGSGRPYNLNVSVQFSNLLNTVNFASPVGNMASSRFGQFTRTQGGFGGWGGFGGSGSANRSITLQARFSW